MIQYGTTYEGDPRYNFGPVKLNPKKTKEEQYGACDLESELEQVSKKLGDIKVVDRNTSTRWIVRK